MRGTRRWATTRRSSMQVILERSVDTFSGFLEPACRGDRKSTRLNSSHLVISYAVFCLKKKKKHLRLASDALVNDFPHHYLPTILYTPSQAAGAAVAFHHSAHAALHLPE